MISVCVATYNGALYIKEQIESILLQLSPDDEIIISDDGSTDKTIEIIKDIKDSRIKILHHKKKDVPKVNSSHILVSNNFENALKEAKGDFIFLSDQDDRWLPGRVAKMMHALEGKDLVMCNFNLINKAGLRIKSNFFGCCPFSDSLLVNLYKMPFYGNAMAFRRSLLKKVLPFPINMPVHDNWIGLIAKKYGEICFIMEALHDYRVHENNVSRPIFSSSQNPLIYKIKYRISFLKWYLIR